MMTLLFLLSSKHKEKIRLGLHTWREQGLPPARICFPVDATRPLFQARAVLTPELVVVLRRRYAAGNISQSSLGTLYGITRATVGRIIRRETWKAIPDEVQHIELVAATEQAIFDSQRDADLKAIFA